MTRYLLVTAAILVTIIAMMAFALQRSMKANGRLSAELTAQIDANEALQDARKRDSATLVLRDRANVATARSGASAGRLLAHSRAASAAWADTPVPAGVLEAFK